MRLSEETLHFLRGEKYSNGLTIDFEFAEEDHAYSTQIDLLCGLASRKRIIHVGCVDHNIATIDHKRKRKKWLHGRLCSSSQRCHGIDIQEEGIRYIREKLGYNDTSAVDIFGEAFSELAAGDTWDSLFIPEVLEHLENPSGFLRQIREKYRNHFNTIVITVPNGLSYDNWQLARKGKEAINSDHHFWFTPYTLAKNVISAGLHVDKILMCRHGTINWRAFRRNRFFRKNPLLRNDILCIAKFT